MKVLVITLALVVFLLGGLTLINYEKVKTRNNAIDDREKTITEYKKVIEAIARTNDIDLDEQLGYYKHDNEYYYILSSKGNDIRKREIWEFMGGLELVLDDKKQFKTVNMFKP